jgi:hypothetical protein
MYPFVHYGKTPIEQSFWHKGEIEPIKALVEAADRELLTGLMNDNFMANDIVLEEEGAVIEGYELKNVPGSKVKVAPGRINSIRRLGGVSANGGLLEMINYLHDKVLETNGNFAVKGQETNKVTTASGLAQLREDRDNRFVIKESDRKSGFQRLYELIDWTALEFYNTQRVIMIAPEGSTDQERQPMPFVNSQMAVADPVMSQQTGDIYTYYPRIDVEITAGDGIQNSKAFTLAASQELARTPITPVNIGIIKSIIDILDLPNKQELKQSIEAAGQQIQQQQMMQQKGGQPGQPGQTPTVQLPPEIQQLQAVMQHAGLSQDEQQTVLQLLQKQSPQQQQQFLSATPEEQLQVINALIGQ